MNTNISLYTVAVVIALHWTFDFVLQTHWQSMNKSSSNEALSRHVAVYAMGLLLMGAYVCKGPAAFCAWTGFNTFAHWVTDYFTSRMNKRLWEANRPHDFFVGVGFDQMIHYLTLFTSLQLLNS